ncbi:MAG: Fic family protein [Planctomycetes bacterium]|nr:Fic family protein [Planctomycetota bacterium]
MRAGRYVKQPTGYRAFFPARLIPKPALAYDDEMTRLLSDADRALGRLDGVASVLPNPDLFVAMYVRHEAVLSSQIEGTQSTLEDVLQFEVEGSVTTDQPKDVEEVVNYIAAMNFGLRRLAKLPLSKRLLCEIHKKLLQGVRGAERQPGEFRTTQNWIGPHGCTLAQAEFVPPPAHEMQTALDDFEKFLHDRSSLPMLIHCALAHAQFETIHPFLDGNGQVGRLLITLLMCEREILQQPLLYLSYFFKAHRAQYYDRLMAIRNDGNWESWVKFFLRGVFEVSQGATETARAILDLREKHRESITSRFSSSVNGLLLLDYLFQHPVISVGMAERHLECAYVTASNLIEELTKMGLLIETTGRTRNRRFQYQEYLDMFERQILRAPTEAAPAQTTRSVPSRRRNRKSK